MTAYIGASNRFRWLLLVAWLILGAGSACAAQVGIASPGTDIGGDWRLKRGDDPTWSAAQLDDADWTPVNLTAALDQNRYRDFVGFFWLRKKIRLDADAAALGTQSKLGIALGPVGFTHYEVYANGTRIGARGTFPPSFWSPSPRSVIFTIPGNVVAADGTLALALRVWRDPRYTGNYPVRPYLVGPFAIGDVSVLTDHAEAGQWQRLKRELPSLLLSYAFLVGGLFHLYLYFQRRQVTEYFWYWNITLFAAINTIFRTAWIDQFLPQFYSHAIADAAFHLNAGFVWIEFTALVIGVKFRRWVRWFQWMQVGLAAMALARLAGIWPMGTWLVATTAIQPFIILPPIIKAAKQGNSDAYFLLGGLLWLIAFRLYELGGVLRLIPYETVSHWGFAGVVFAYAFMLAGRFTRVYERQDSLNRDLEKLVTDRTTQLSETVARLVQSEHQAIEAKEAALLANRAKSAFLANMSHELRTPLNGIIGFAQLMETEEGLTDKQRSHLATILGCGEHLLTLINDVLTISKIEAGRMTLHETAFEPAKFLTGIDDMFRLKAASKKLGWSVVLSPDFPRLVRGDEGKLRQILFNLTGNALKFTERGQVSLTAEWVGNQARFTVTDTGPGISPQDQARLFQPFFQSPLTETSNEGTGLGLAITRNFIEMMGGRISMRSTLGEGTTFIASLPLAVIAREERRAVERHVQGVVQPTPPRRILVVDDQLDNRKLLAMILGTSGFEIREAANGSEAIATATGWIPDLILMDLYMPGLNGLEATRRIRSDLNRRSIGQPVIIAISASIFGEEPRLAREAGCNDFIPKPFRNETIFKTLADHLHLTVRYADEPATPPPPTVEFLDSDRLASQPVHWRDRLRHELNAGNITAALTTVAQVNDERLAKLLKSMIEQYRFDEIVEALDRLSP